MSGDFRDCYINFILKHLSGKCGSDILEWSTSGAICTIWLQSCDAEEFRPVLYTVQSTHTYSAYYWSWGRSMLREHIEFRYPRDLF